MRMDALPRSALLSVSLTLGWMMVVPGRSGAG
jgi:hypothetical protein